MCDKTRKIRNWTIPERDLDIFLRWLKGDKPREIAIDEHISRQRVYNIIAKVRLFRGEEVYEDPYDLRYLQSITPRVRKILLRRGVNNIKELAEWVKHNRLISISGIGDIKEKKILIQLDDFMRQRHKEEQDSKSKNKPWRY